MAMVFHLPKESRLGREGMHKSSCSEYHGNSLLGVQGMMGANWRRARAHMLSDVTRPDGSRLIGPAWPMAKEESHPSGPGTRTAGRQGCRLSQSREAGWLIKGECRS